MGAPGIGSRPLVLFPPPLTTPPSLSRSGDNSETSPAHDAAIPYAQCMCEQCRCLHVYIRVLNVCASSTDAYVYTYMCSMYVRAVQVPTCMQVRSFCINLEKIKALRGEGEGAGLLLYRHFCAVARQEPTCRRS